MSFRRRRPASRKGRWFLILLALGLLLLAATWLALPPILRSQGEKRLSAALHRPVTIGKISLNPFNLAVTVDNFAIHEPGGKEVFLGWDRLYVSFELISFFRHKWKFTEIQLSGPHARVAVNPDGSLNFSDLLALASAPGPVAKGPVEPPRPLVVTRFVLTGARLDFSDRSRPQPFATTLGPVGFSVRDFHTAGSEQSPYSFEAVTESGEKFAWHGWMEAVPFRSGGELTVSGLILKKYSPYYADKVGVDLADGRLSVSGRYLVSFDARTRSLKLLDGAVKLRNLKLVERASGETLLDLPAADVRGITADGLAFKAAVDQVEIVGAHARLRREKDGNVNLGNVLPPPSPALVAAAPAAPPAATPAPPLSFNLGHLLVRDCAVDIHDAVPKQPADLALTEMGLKLDNFSLADGAVMPFEAALRVQPKGTVRALGTVSLKPVKADFRLEVDSLGLLPLSPYVEQNVNLRLADGTASLKGQVTLALAASGAPEATFAGDAWLERFSVLDQVHVEELAGFSDLILSGIKVATAPQLSLSIEGVNVNSPYGRVVMDHDQKLNVASIIPAAPPAPPGAAPGGGPRADSPMTVSLPGAPAPTGPVVEVGRVVITGGDFSFVDQSITPNARIAVTGFEGTLTGLSSRNPGRGDADLKATIGGSAPLAIKGHFDPLGPNLFVDANVTLKGYDLLPFSPYSGRYAGYELARGKLFLDVTAHVADRKLDITDNVTLDQFTFGRATNSPEATKAPVRFGVALLKDLDGKIELPVPIQGSLDDPDFKIGGVIWHVIGNVIIKAAASPFTFLGSLFGGGGQELSWQDFAAGESVLNADGLKKLDTLAKALTARPGLNLALEGSFDPEADAAVLRQKKLVESVRHAIWEQRHLRDPNIAPPDQIEISPPEYAAALKRMFDAKFPPGTEFGTQLPPPRIVPPPAPPSGNLIKRVFEIVTLKRPRELGAYRIEQQKAQKEYMKELKDTMEAGTPQEEMVARLLETITVTPDDLRALADARVQRVRAYLTDEGHISSDRLFQSQPTDNPPADAAAGKGAKVFLTMQ